MNLKMVGHVESNRTLGSREDMNRDTSFNHLKKTTNYKSKKFSLLVILLLISQSVIAVQANVSNVSYPNNLQYLAPGSEDITTSQEGIQREESSNGYRPDEVSQVLASGKLESVISPFLWKLTTSNAPLEINVHVLHRKVRDTSPYTAPVTCVPTEKELDELLEVLQDENPTFRGTSGAKHCSQVVEIRNEIINLKSTFHQLSSNINSVSRYEELKLRYDEEVQSLERKIEDFRRNENQEMSRKMAEFVSNFYTLVLTDMARLVTKSEETQKSYFESLIRICIYEIKDKEYKKAAITFSTLQNTKPLERICKSVYANDLANVQVILSFLKEVPSTVEQNVMACSSIYNEMMINNQLQSSEVLMLENLISETLRMPHIKNTAEQNFTDTLIGLKQAIESPVRYIITTWSVKIKNGNYSDILGYIESPFINITEHLSLLTELAFNNDSRNTEHVLGFVKGFTSIAKSGIIYETLYNEMRAIDGIYDNRVLQFTFQMKKVMDSIAFRDSSDEDKSRFISTKKRLKANVRLLFWKRVCIKHVYLGEYLQFIAPYNQLVMNPDQLRPVNLTKGVWRFIPVNEGTSFHICTAKEMLCWNVEVPRPPREFKTLYVHSKLKTASENFESWKIALSKTDKQLVFYPFLTVYPLRAATIISGKERNTFIKYKFRQEEYTRFELEKC